MTSRSTGRARLAAVAVAADQSAHERFRPPPIAVALPDKSTLQVPAIAWAGRQVWRAHARPGRPPILAIHELTRAWALELERKWAGAPDVPRFGARAFAFLADHRAVALLIAANADDVEVDERVGLRRANCIELARLCHDPQEHGSQELLLRVWRDRLAVHRWPYYPHVPKVALICYPGRSGADALVSATEGWVHLTDDGVRGPLWAYWLSERTPASVALSEPPSDVHAVDAKAIARVAA